MLRQTFATPHQAASGVLQVVGLHGGPGDTPLFQNLGFCLPSGVTALQGDESTGKTSLLRLLAGDLQASAAQWIWPHSPDCTAHPPPASVFWAELRLPLHDMDTPLEYWATLRRSWPNWSDATQNTLVEALQMGPHLGKRLNMLSTGSRRKVGLIAALACGAMVTLLDQPFVSLDQASIDALKSHLNTASAQTHRAWVVADYEIPTGITLTSCLHLSC